MMLKSFGVDPEKLKKTVTETLDALKAELTELKEAQLRTEKLTERILTRVEVNHDFLNVIREQTHVPVSGGSLDSMNSVTSEPESEQYAERLTDGGSFDSTR